ncbi:MAG: type III secretion inner membrane ring lipoprotein SctJ [Planctomycetaceae bacterium]|nr:type III secretion inner membrane ring lipoprotein SctJ [Planctomycetaceae bacterium]
MSDKQNPTHRRIFSASCGRLVLWSWCLLAVMGCGKVELYSDLPESEANEMMAVLMENGISCAKQAGDEQTWTLSVSNDRFADSVRLLKEQGYPKDKFADMGQMFQKSGLVSSPSEERIRFMYALSQELSNTISRIDGVLSARVHIVLPENSPFGKEVQPSSAAVFIKHQYGTDLDTSITDIKELVISSIEGLDAEKVSVVLFESEAPQQAAKRMAVEYHEVFGVAVRKGSETIVYSTLAAAAGLVLLCLLFTGWILLARRGNNQVVAT